MSKQGCYFQQYLGTYAEHRCFTIGWTRVF